MRLFAKLVIVMLVVAMVPLVSLNLFLHSMVSSTLYDLVEQRLAGIAELQQQRVDAVAREKLDLLRQVSSRTQLRLSLRGYLETGDADALAKVEVILEDARSANADFLSISLIDAQGRVVVGGNDLPAQEEPFTSKFVESSLRGETIECENLGTEQPLRIRVSGPLQLDGVTLGLVSILTTGDQLRAIATDYSEMGNAGETQIGMLRGDGIIQLFTPHRDGTEDNLRIRPSEASHPMWRALAGETEVVYREHGYHGEPILAAPRSCQVTSWGIVAVLDAAEALAPLNHLRWVGIATTVATLVTVVLLALVIARSVTAPLHELRNTTLAVTESGNYETSVVPRTRDEIGELCLAFNEMLVEIHRRDEALQEVNRQLHCTNRELAHSNKELNDFAYIASHDLKEPLRGIAYYCEYLREDYTHVLGVEGNRQLDVLQKLADRMRQLIDSLLRYSRAGTSVVQRRPTNLNEVLDDVLESLSVLIEEKGAEVKANRPLPVIDCDPMLVHEVLANLITNGIKYNTSEVRKVTLDWEQGSTAILSVADNGIGIAEKHHQKIFGIFKRLHTTDSYDGGSGVGLAIVQKVIQRHGGRIWVESAEGAGTIFRFTLESDDSQAMRGSHI